MDDDTIRLSDAAVARLDRHKRSGESYEDVIFRLTERDPCAGFGALADSEDDSRAGMERIREEMREEWGDDPH